MTYPFASMASCGRFASFAMNTDAWAIPAAARQAAKRAAVRTITAATLPEEQADCHGEPDPRARVQPRRTAGRASRPDAAQALRQDGARVGHRRHRGHARGRGRRPLLRRPLGDARRHAGGAGRAPRAQARRLLRRGRADDEHAAHRLGPRHDFLGGRELRPGTFDDSSGRCSATEQAQRLPAHGRIESGPDSSSTTVSTRPRRSR